MLISPSRISGLIGSPLELALNFPMVRNCPPTFSLTVGRVALDSVTAKRPYRIGILVTAVTSADAHNGQGWTLRRITALQPNTHATSPAADGIDMTAADPKLHRKSMLQRYGFLWVTLVLFLGSTIAHWSAGWSAYKQEQQ